MSDSKPDSKAPIRVDVCVVTCQRPRGLLNLLRGLQRLRLPQPGPRVRVIVIDNDPGASARATCAEAAAWLPWPLLYRLEKRRGIPNARNAALAVSRPEADFVAFIDDDEVPEPAWLAELLAACSRYGADAVTGPVDREFEAAPRWLRESGLFDPRCLATGEAVDMAYTNNVLVSSRALGRMDALFDERMALIGSSDSEFFGRFVASGFRIVWCESARVREWVPASRARWGWLVRRALRVGASSTFIDRSRDPRLLDRIRIAAHGTWCLGKGALLAALALPRGGGAVARGVYLACVGAGRLAGLVGWTYREYRVIHGE